MSNQDLTNERLSKRVSDSVCAACRRPFQAGDRLMPTFIVLAIDVPNPENITAKSLELNCEMEFVHCRCEDRALDGRRVELT